jgi:hydroxymethylpyrimidine pyrophosphatase-like HAD family hydrolase
MNKRVCVTDLDGTLLHSQRRISERNLETLHTLGEMGITRVLATGRSLWSLRQVIADDTPFDYAIISTGAGIMDWREQKLIHCANIRPPEICNVFSVLEELDLDYMLHRGVPDTHLMDIAKNKAVPTFGNASSIIGISPANWIPARSTSTKKLLSFWSLPITCAMMYIPK